MKKQLVFISILSIGITAGAATTKITANLESVKFNVNGAESMQEAIIYNDTTYVPIRKAAELLGTKVDYKNNTVYLEKEPQPKVFTFKINDVRIETNDEGERVAIVNIDFTNNCGNTIRPIQSPCSVAAFQNGLELEKTFDFGILTGRDCYSSVLSGYTLNYDEMFIIQDNSPITIEIEDAFGGDKVTKVLVLE